MDISVAFNGYLNPVVKYRLFGMARKNLFD